ncbi:MAG: DJ-1/PfpI family protein [Candidatus Heimdallarchaeota archaeon]|nr:MAG: DJ-1/PfpI family protein [Candidatus Heimdallarchaeota archaeon]
MKKIIKIILVGFFIITFVGQLMLWFFLDARNSALNQGMSIRGASIVFFTADGYSEGDLQGVKQYFDQWQGEVTIAGLSENLTTIDGSMTSDILLFDINEITLYDAIVLPGGELAPALNADHHVMQLLEDANNEGLVIVGIGNGTLVQANAGLLEGKKFTTHSSIVDNLTAAGGFYVDGANVVVDGTIITVSPPNYEELAYTVANTLGYTYNLEVDISFDKEEQGWNYSISVVPSDKHIVERMSINLSLEAATKEKTLVNTIELIEKEDGIYTASFGILNNGFYIVDAEIESIYGKIELRTDISEFSVGSN